jgi:hypothetical protein
VEQELLRAHEFIPGVVRVARSLSFCVEFWRSLFVLFSFGHFIVRRFSICDKAKDLVTRTPQKLEVNSDALEG